MNYYRRVKRNNVWPVIYDVKPAISDWEREVKLRFRPTIINLKETINKEKESLTFKPIKIETTELYLRKKGKLLKPSFLILSLFLLIFSITFFFNRQLVIKQKIFFAQNKPVLVNSLTASFESLSQGQGELALKYLQENKGVLLSQRKPDYQPAFYQKLLAQLTNNPYLNLDEEYLKTLNEAENALELFLETGQIEDLEKYQKAMAYLVPLLNDNQTNQSWFKINNLINNLNQLVAKKGSKNYLLLFQDTNTLRPTGGYLGYYGFLKIENGQAVNLSINNSHNLDLALESKIIPPEPLKVISTNWLFHDLNWFFDFPVTANKILAFIQPFLKEPVDGVIAINSSFFPEVLKIIGPLNIKGREINENNFSQLLSNEIYSNRLLTANDQFVFFSDFINLFVEKIKSCSAEQRKILINLLFDSLKNKDIQIYVLNKEWQRDLEQSDLAAKIKDSDDDYLAVIASNIGSEGRDQFIHQTINLEVQIKSDGQIDNILTIFRHYDDTSLKNIEQAEIRVYLPSQAKILEVQNSSKAPSIKSIDYQKKGFQEDDTLSQLKENQWFDGKNQTTYYFENKKLVASNWMILKAGETKKIVYRYQLPFKVTKEHNFYRLNIQKQAGINSDFHFLLKIAPDFPYQVNNQNFSQNFVLNQDREISFEFYNQ